MARRAGDLYLLTVVAIFVVVLGTMWAGLQYERGELLPEQPIDDEERRLRIALWAEFDGWRADRDLGPARRLVRVEIAAQEAAVAFAAANGSGGVPSVTPPPEADLQRDGNLCLQVLVHHVTDHPGWSGTADAPADESVVDAVAGEVLAALVAADDRGLLRRSGTFVTGIGVVAEGDDLYVVYRSCVQRRLSP